MVLRRYSIHQFGVDRCGNAQFEIILVYHLPKIKNFDQP